MRKIILVMLLIIGVVLLLYFSGLVGAIFVFIVGMAIITFFGYILICFRENKRNFKGHEN